MSKDDLVRGKKRQRRRAPKTRSGCATCKVRHVKCGEERPNCLKCTSTGRKCDGYSTPSDSSPPKEVATDLDLPGSNNQQIVRTKVGYASVATTKESDCAHLPNKSTRHGAILPIPVYTFRALSIPQSMSRAFEYFLRRTSIDLAGPLCIQIWGSYILGVSTNSPAIQHGIAALSGIHERHGLSKSSSSRIASDSWKHYYLAVKATNALVATSQDGGSKHGSSSKEEILIACAIFVTIEVLLGNMEAALRHLEGGFSLIQAYFTKANTDARKSSEGDTLDKISPNTSSTYLDSHLTDLMGFFARLDLQLLSFLPRGHYPSFKPAAQPEPPVAQLCQPLPDVMSASLHGLIKQSLSWIRHHATPFKYTYSIPTALYEKQASLTSMLCDWQISHFAEQEPSTTPTPEAANLLLAHHLTALKVHTALSANEHIFATPDCLALFEAVLEYAAIIVAQRERNPSQDGNFAQLVSFFSLEMSTVEALYFTATKCREPSHRRRAVELLKSAGREGVWDGSVMAKIAEHVIAREEGASSCSSSDVSASPAMLEPGLDQYYFDDETFLQAVGFDDALDLDLFLTTPKEQQQFDDSNLINEVMFTLDRENDSVQVECGWYSERTSCWRYESTALTL